MVNEHSYKTKFHHFDKHRRQHCRRSTGAILLDLPYPALTHADYFLPRFAKIRKHLEANCRLNTKATKGFESFLCLHLGVEPAEIIECVKQCSSESQLNEKLAVVSKDLKVHAWNHKVVK